MNRRLVACLLASGLTGLAAAALAFGGGWGVLPALLTYSLVASLTLLVATLILLPGVPAAAAPPRAAGRKRRVLA